jgi:radical SAM protein with 4Fe4S-binding SPASM domain
VLPVKLQGKGKLGAVAAPIPEVPFSALRARLQPEERRIPIEGTLETTFRCNLNCVHCYVNEPAASRTVQRRELPTARLIALLDEIAAAGTLSLLLTGGEPLLRPDFPEVYLAALRRGLLVTVFTNGTLVTERIAELFAEYTPERVEVSVYGMTPGTYERITRTPGAHARCMAGIARLTARRIPLKLKTMAMTWNRHEIGPMREYARRGGADFVFDGLLNPRVDCGANRNTELQLGADQLLALDFGDRARTAELRAFCERFARPEAAGPDDRLFTCGAGQTAFTVDPCGRLQMCQLLRRSWFDIRHAGFAEGWNGFFPRLRARRWQSAAPCRRCSLISLCGSCPGAAELEHGEIEGLVAPFCRIAHARAHAMLGESCGHRPDAACCLDRAAEGSAVKTVAPSATGSAPPARVPPAPPQGSPEVEGRASW